MRRLKVEARGRALIASAVVLLAFGGLFGDALMLCASLIPSALAAASLASAARLSRWIPLNVRVEPSSVSLRLVAGGKKSVKVTVASPGWMAFRFRHPLRFFSVHPERCAGGGLLLEASPEVSGRYSSGHLEVEAEALLGAFSVRAAVPFRCDVTVIPRVVPAALEALRLALSTSPGGALGEASLPQRIGRGLEYAETDEYLPGDDVRRIDWKATARLGRLMVKRFHEELGGDVNLIFDLKSSSPASRDLSATVFLSLATALSASEVPYRITLLHPDGRAEAFKFRDWKSALLTAVNHALSAVEVGYSYLYEVLAPSSSREALALLRMLDGAYGEPAASHWGSEGWSDAVAVSCLVGDLTWLVDVHEEAEGRGGRLLVYACSKAWLGCGRLEEAYAARERFFRLVSALRRRGIEVEVR
ncbi:MAG: DUF58 domain-containing protein [Candidatus Nezhaarchaeota archaeon]|nr:DUF58 domain-containing protein [Candidatus Nezhaarchaeota archaeon]